ncbi:asparaginase domain-containing protein [Arenicella xantha]|uniref:L-asparaginase n=1 Tax=Arenicella xantha TaxID=644221 RepID=A0A395JLD0_9GAMM|nr:asparaginase domain-containing protein [Arenicella xantha]RBP51409.1 L-asparaginase [Arenicella xantha]
MKIQIFCVGGTIDKIYFDAKSKYEVGSPAIGKLLAELSIHFSYKVDSLMAKDSLEMTDEDRRLIREAVMNSSSDRILITHGTDTMPETARALLGIDGKTIVLTGALAPAIFRDSDAAFNVGGALAAAQSKPAGVYIVMNGEVFDGDKVRKDVEANRFVGLAS